MKLPIIIKKYNKDGEPLTGFTLLELIISIFVLSIGVVGIFSAFSMMTILTSDAADRLTATYLAQEGMEIVRNIRDTNWLTDGSGWADGFSVCAGGCEVTYASEAMTGGSSRHLYINSNGFYDYNDTDPDLKSKFERKIIIECLPAGDCGSDYIMKVTTQVSWDEKANILHSGLLAGICGSYNCIRVEGTLYNWYNYVPPTP